MENKEHLDTLPVEKKRTWPRRLLRGALVCLAVLAAACVAFVGYTIATAPALDTGDVSPDGWE